MEAVVPNARIPWHDWSAESDVLDNSVWSDSRLGSANVNCSRTNCSGQITNGPFEDFDANLTRSGDPDVFVASPRFISDIFNVTRPYHQFVTAIEGYAHFSSCDWRRICLNRKIGVAHSDET